MTTVLLERVRLPEARRKGHRLGRHVNHDSRSRAYPVRLIRTRDTTRRKRVIPVLNQGGLGSCTGNAETGALGSEGLFETIITVLAAKSLVLDEDFAIKLYARGTQLDDYAGTYPPTDTGSDGLSVSKAALELGLISGYVHAFSLDDMIAGLQLNAGIIGVNWYSSFDQPGADGLLSLPATAYVRGGHELHVLNVDVDRMWFEVVNSWGPDWAVGGTCYVPFQVMERLLREDGDATFPVPLTEVVVPTPPVTDPDRNLVVGVDPWASQRTILSTRTKAGRAKIAYEQWKNVKNL